MTDPKPPRPFPPPLPGAMREPFPLADSDRPPAFRRSLDCPQHDQRCTQSLCVLDPLHPLHWQTQRARNDAVDRAKVTPRDGSVAVLDADPRDGMIRELQSQLVLLREQLDQPPETPVPLTRPSQRVRRAQLAKVLGKWTVLLTLLPLVGGIVAKRWPEYSGIVDTVLQLVGLK